MALNISEKWIRERVHLDPENLADVRSLALPGTYHEKITHLGSALQNFSRLKHLDLSRNALQSLDGLQTLSVLEKLNIYYNNISTLKDLYALRHNSSLQEVDLRLNPVTKNEPDYRLFMVHMLPNLRKLDDRSVRESEREAALLHFSSDQATDLTEHAPVRRRTSTDRVINPRVEMVSNIPRTTTVLDEDDCDVLDLIARSGGDLGRPREITGSTAKTPQATTHTHPDHSGRSTPEGLTERDKTERNDLPSTKYPPSPVSVAAVPPTDRHKGSGAWGGKPSAKEHELEGRMHGLDLSAGTEGSGTPTHHAGSYPQSKERVRVQFTNGDTDLSRHDGSRHFATSYSDETQAYTAYTSRGHFTPRPDSDNHTAETIESRNASYEYGSVRPTEELSKALDTASDPTRQKRVDLNLFLDNFLSLVDRYWNGTKSLHRHGKFQSQAHTLLSTLTSEITATVAAQRPHIPSESTAEVTKLMQALRSSQDQGERLKGELDKAFSEKRNLQQRLDAVQHDEQSGDSQSDRGVRSGVLEREMENLIRENESLKLQVKHFNQLQELATMLQESHKSLVTTNDHLLQELDETKQRHLEEVKQLHWSYGELKRTMELMPNQQGARPMDHLRPNGIQ